ncbi:hypothetical protein DY000_02040333 [Brassica cretica]|uniref:Uncharacterized protein n=1 Tax=Brassica cretica TaxID=69181 RepID=A0ABQ7B8Y5_BRACR|nr:hypothetical protein DY000_02040333 [Brassica cretica]
MQWVQKKRQEDRHIRRSTLNLPGYAHYAKLVSYPEVEMVRCPLRLDMERFYAYEKAKEKAKGEGEGEGEEEGEGEGEGDGDGDVEMMMMMMMSGITSPSRGHKLIIYGLVVWDGRMAQMGVTI